MAEPNIKEIDAKSPTISLAGKEWPIPLLAPRQNRIIVPAIMRMRKSTGTAGLDIDTQTYSDVCDIVFAALTRAHKDLTRNEFDDMPISTKELFEALDVIGIQTGILAKKPDSPLLTPETTPVSSL